MKMLKLTVIAFAFTSLSSCGQNENAPKKVQDAFSAKFPTAKEVSWDKENATEWEAEFEMNGKEYSSNFSSDGVWKETEHSVLKSEIPSNIKNTLANDFSSYDIEEIEISETTEGTVYEFELEKGESTIDVSINLAGKVVKKEVKTEEEED